METTRSKATLHLNFESDMRTPESALQMEEEVMTRLRKLCDELALLPSVTLTLTEDFDISVEWGPAQSEWEKMTDEETNTTLQQLATIAAYLSETYVNDVGLYGKVVRH